MTTKQLTEQVRRNLMTLPKVKQIEEAQEDGNASQGFADSCDNYEGFAFSAYIDGRQYYVTIEDVTTPDEAAEASAA